jgi:hypothetical protein
MTSWFFLVNHTRQHTFTMAMAAAGSGNASSAAVRVVYREILRLVRQRPDAQSAVAQVKESFRRPLDHDTRSASLPAAESSSLLAGRLQEAESRLSVLRMTTNPRSRRSSSGGVGGKWVYKDGQRLSAENGTLRDSGGRVVSSFDGKNLDPESVKRHQQQLKRAGFANNEHAKGFF